MRRLFILAQIQEVWYNMFGYIIQKGESRVNICVFGAASQTIDPLFIQAGEALGREMGRRGHGLVFGGGDTGLMGATARGVQSFGGRIVGVAPTFFDKPGVLFTNCTDLIFTDTMRQRKQKMEDLSDAFIVAPGGIGTLEEFFEIYTLKTLDKTEKPIAVLNIADCYTPLRAAIAKLTEQGFLTDEACGAVSYFTTPDAAINYLEAMCSKFPESHRTPR